MALLLEKTQSSYYPAFRELYHETYNALQEDLEIDSYLIPIVSHLESLRNGEFDEIEKNFEYVFHAISLLWSHSKYYCRPTRIIVLLQELNNLSETFLNYKLSFCLKIFSFI